MYCSIRETDKLQPIPILHLHFSLNTFIVILKVISNLKYHSNINLVYIDSVGKRSTQSVFIKYNVYIFILHPPRNNTHSRIHVRVMYVRINLSSQMVLWNMKNETLGTVLQNSYAIETVCL